MTNEERLELLKALTEGKMVEVNLEKHVEYEIGNVEAGGIGVQINNGGKPAETPAKKEASKKKSQSSGKILDAVFRYTYLEHDESSQRLAMLHQFLTKAGWLDQSVKVDTFLSLFAGTPKSFTMKWKGTQQNLYYLIKKLIERELIECQGSSKWVITGSHFVDSTSHPFADWNKQKDPAVSASAIEHLCDVLDISVPLDEFRSR